jgi:hypothetical protein
MNIKITTLSPKVQLRRNRILKSPLSRKFSLRQPRYEISATPYGLSEQPFRIIPLFTLSLNKLEFFLKILIHHDRLPFSKPAIMVPKLAIRAPAVFSNLFLLPAETVAPHKIRRCSLCLKELFPYFFNNFPNRLF